MLDSTAQSHKVLKKKPLISSGYRRDKQVIRGKQVLSFTLPYGKPESWVTCDYCGRLTYKKLSHQKKTMHNFCCISHSSLFYQTPKKKDRHREVYRYDL